LSGLALFATDKAKAFPRAFEKRQKSDYGDFSTVTRKEGQAIRGEVSDFIDECEQMLKRLLAEE
jgi:hypothetical protein